jgi:hypothetical protein
MIVKLTTAPKIAPFSSKPRGKWGRNPVNLRDNQHLGKLPHHVVDSQPPTKLPILSCAFSTTNISKQPCPSFDLLPIQSLHHYQLSSTFTSSTNNLPSRSVTNHIPYTNQMKAEPNPPPPPPQQIQKPPQQPDAFPTHGTILTITGGSNTDFDTKRQRRD